MSQSRYDYDENSETWPYFALTGVLVPLIPVTISSVSSFVSYVTAQSNKDEPTETEFITYNSNEIKKYKSKKKSKSLFTKQNIFLIIGWAFSIYLILKINSIEAPVGEINFDPWKILGIDESASDKDIKLAYRYLSKKYHPDKFGTVNRTEEEIAANQALYILISKANQALTDDAVKENFLKYGNPDGPAEVKHGIALPKMLVDGPTSPFLMVIYVLLIAVILPLFVNSWWTGVKSYTKLGLHVDTTTHFLEVLLNYNPAKLVTIQSIFEYISHAKEFTMLKKSLTPEKVQELLLAQINRTKLDTKEELLKLEVVVIATRLIIGFLDLASTFRNSEICFQLVEAHRGLIQALNIEGDAKTNKFKQILQLPGVSLDKLDTTQPIHTLGKLLKKPSVEPSKFLNVGNVDEILQVASQIPLIEPLDCKFKVTDESYIPPSSTVHIDLRFVAKSPAQKSKPEKTKLSKKVIETQLTEPQTLENLRNPFKIVEEQPKLKLDTLPSYFPDVQYLKEHNGWVAFLVVQRDGKLGETPHYITRLDSSNLKLSQEDFLDSKAVVSTFKFPLTSPTPKEAGTFPFRLVIKNLLYFGSDIDIPVVMRVEDKPAEISNDDLYGIEDPDEDSIAGALAQMRGEKVRKIENEYESSDDDSDVDEEDEDTSDWTDLDTDTEDEEVVEIDGN